MNNEESRLYPVQLTDAEHFMKRCLEEVEPIKLTQEQRAESDKYQERLFARFKELAVDPEHRSGSHEVFSSYFTTIEGMRLFHMVYKDIQLTDRVLLSLEEQGIKFDISTSQGQKDRRELFEAVFKDLVVIAETEDSFNEYFTQGRKFTNPEEKLGGKAEVFIVGKAGDGKEEEKIPSVQVPKSVKNAAQLLNEGISGLSNIDYGIRKGLGSLSGEYEVKQGFAKDFIEHHGDVEEIDDPRTVTKIVDPEYVAQDIGNWREYKLLLKRNLKELEEAMADGEVDSNLTAYNIELTKYYLYLTNIKIASKLSIYRVFQDELQWEIDEDRRLQVEGALKSLRVATGDRLIGGDSGANNQQSRNVKRIDQYINGITREYDQTIGLWNAISNKLSQRLDERASGELSQEKDPLERYRKIMLNPRQIAALVDIVLEIYGFDDWRASLSSRKTLAVNRKEKSVKIPDSPSLKRDLISAIEVVAHEVEGHVVQHNNSDLLSDVLFTHDPKEEAVGLSLRNGVFSEGGAMYAQKRTAKLIGCNSSQPARTYYYGIKERQQGGSFKDVFKVFLATYAQDNLGMNLETILQPENIAVYSKAVDYCFPRVKRLFRRHTPFDDKSGYVTTSSQLDYAKQELVGEVLAEVGAEHILFMPRTDLETYAFLRKLKDIDPDKIRTPIFASAQLFFSIKERLDAGEDIETVLNNKDDLTERVKERLANNEQQNTAVT